MQHHFTLITPNVPAVFTKTSTEQACAYFWFKFYVPTWVSHLGEEGVWQVLMSEAGYLGDGKHEGLQLLVQVLYALPWEHHRIPQSVAKFQEAGWVAGRHPHLCARPATAGLFEKCLLYFRATGWWHSTKQPRNSQNMVPYSHNAATG